VRTELLQIRIHAEDKKDFMELAKERNRKASELIIDYIKQELILWRREKANK